MIRDSLQNKCMANRKHLSQPRMNEKGYNMTIESMKGSVFFIDDQTEGLMAAIPNIDNARTYQCEIGTCDNPVCTCMVLYLSFTPLDPADRKAPGFPYRVDLDIDRKELAYKDESGVPKDHLAFAKLLLSNMDEADFKLLSRVHFAYKHEQTEAAPLDAIDAVFDFDMVENQGAMYAYSEVLPYGEMLRTEMNGRDCMVFDQYCLKSKCSCKTATLSFVQEGGKTDPDSKELFAVEADYQKKRWAVVESIGIQADIPAARLAMEATFPDLYKRLRSRHTRLRKIYANCMKKHFKQQPIKQEATLQKVGRNDPCPCGSGKKYKKCCM